MNFEFSDEQKMLREQAGNFLREKSPLTAVREIYEGDEAYQRELWQEMAGLGWMSTTIPEQYGGIGLGSLELCVIAEQLGRSLAATPFSSSVYLATEAILMAGSEAQKESYLPQLASGELIGCFALSEGPCAATGNNLQTRFESGTLSGTKLPVTDGNVADFAIVCAKDPAGISWYLVDLCADGVERRSVQSLDPSRDQALIEFNNAPAQLLGDAGSGWQLTNALYNRAAVLFAFEQTGGALAALDQAKAYAMERYAFGRPIGSFQAIKHKLANMYALATLAHSNCYYGAWALSTDAPELALAAATARVSATRAYNECASENIQTHGGMGFTWEFDCHFHLRRARVLALNLGSQYQWEDKLVTALEQRNQAAA
jgi:alkylation response protein AidB-like acyl-CoA dehydrogenase